ncbi:MULTISPECIES: hypothetical protein [unclassified Pseudomonas]|uniref:hypothetical protein n=1 Tax=unclassified Pseudomonas TaxID=196821 RepID=UPI000D3CA0A9|nr:MULTISPECIES: hypothetical protein [unclassified Pseudomonas]RAU43448.1 hypothetical protein DBP26_019810 [Pseudomonas sp. RIT 409]RAU50016.1 hypothetical protein DBY65_022975 [Pseudomonas sp. RIT 412]
MAVTLKKLEKDDRPEYFRAQQIDPVFQVTAADGQVFYEDSEEDAAALVTRLHVEDQRENTPRT